MAFHLDFDGAGDFAQLPQDLVINSPWLWEFDIEILSQNGFCVLAGKTNNLKNRFRIADQTDKDRFTFESSSGGAVQAFEFIRTPIRENGRQIFALSSNDANLTYTMESGGETRDITVGALGFTNIENFNAFFVDSAGTYAHVRCHRIRIWSDVTRTTLIHDWNANSIQSNGAGNILYDDVGGLNATLTGGTWGVSPDANNPPIANAGADQNVTTGTPVQLDGSGSSDPDVGDTLTYLWNLTVPVGSSATLSSTTAVSPTFTPDIDGTYTVSLVVNDGTVDSTADTMVVTANEIVLPPALSGVAFDMSNLEFSATIERLTSNPVISNVQFELDNLTFDIVLDNESTIDTTPPVITLNGSANVVVQQGDTYTDAGATALDDVDGDITANIVTVNPVDTATLGTYTVTYTATDVAGNTATATRVVNVVAVPDTTKPVINLVPSTLVYNLTVGDTFTLPTATLTDDRDNTRIIAPTSNNVNTSTAGSYSVVYSGYEDNAGNVADTVTIIVNVVAEQQLSTTLQSSDFELLSDSILTSYANRSNIEVMQFKAPAAISNELGLFDFTANNITKVEVTTSLNGTTGSTIDSDGTAVSFENDELFVELGALTGVGVEPLAVIVYTAEDSKGLVICGPGTNNSNATVTFIN